MLAPMRVMKSNAVHRIKFASVIKASVPTENAMSTKPMVKTLFPPSGVRELSDGHFKKREGEKHDGEHDADHTPLKTDMLMEIYGV